MKNIFYIAIISLLHFQAFAQDFNGYALYNKQNVNTAYLIDKDGNIAKTWNCNVPAQIKKKTI